MDKPSGDQQNKTDMVSKRAVFSGRVQGVGFRYATQELSDGFRVNGYVRNQSDGTVEVVAEGEANEVDSFLAELGRRMGNHIEQTSVADAPPAGSKGFRIRY
jgi:acylphosphatase